MGKVIFLENNSQGTNTFTDVLEIIPPPFAAFDYTINNNFVSFNNYSTPTSITNITWSFGNGDGSNIANPSYIYPSIGEWPVVLLVINDCGQDTSLQRIEILTTSINELDGSLFLSVFPNPSKGNFSITIGSDQSTTLDWSLVNLHGQQIMTGQQAVQAGSNQFSIDATDLAAGVYFTHFQNELGIKTVKVIIQ